MTPLLVATLTVFIAVALLAGGAAAWVLNQNSPERRRLRQVIESKGGSGVIIVEAPQVAPDQPSRRWVEIEKLLPKSPAEMGRLRRRLTLAGYRNFAAAIFFTIAELVLPIVFAGAALIWIAKPLGWLLAAAGAFLGFLTPGFWLERMIERRKRQIRNGLPDALDLLVVCLEAGSSLDQGLVKAGAELQIAYPDLAHELQTIITETRAGKSRLDAFKNFAERTKLDETRSLVAMLVQTDRFGTSVSQALRSHAETVRTQRRQAAEEKAAKVGVKLVFPLVLFMFPALWVVLLGSAVVDFLRVFAQFR